MQDALHDDIRKLLKTFGVKADETIVAYLAASRGDSPIRLRVTLEDVTDYGATPPPEKLNLTVEGEVRRSA